MGLLLGLDFGTGGVRAGLFDPDARRTVALAEEAYATHHPRPGWAEQSPRDWWEAAGRACRRLLRGAGDPEVAAVAAATTASTVVACRRDGTPIRPALLWMDCRAGAEAARTAAAVHPVLAHSGGGDAAEWLVPKAMWLATREPALWATADVVCECLDWVNFHLAGRWVASRTNATCKWNWDGVAGRACPDLYEALGVAGLASRLPGEVIPVGGPIGRLAEAAAAHLGIRGRPLLAQGGIDAHVGMLGADVVDPGGLLMIGGTSVVHLFHMDAERPVPGFWGPYPNALVDGLWMVEGGQVSAGSVLSWPSRTMFGPDEAGTDALAAEALRRPVDGDGFLVLDFFMGNRTPYRDPDLRGALLGLSLGHDRASVYRAAAEGVALASANVVGTMRALGIPTRRTVSAGGYARNALWMQATVDAIGLPIEMAAEENLTVVGCAAAAGTASGLFADLREAACRVTRPGRLVEPDPARHAVYADMLGRYRDTTALLADRLRDLAARAAKRHGGRDAG